MRFFTLEKLLKQHIDIKQAIYREILNIPRFKFHEGQIPNAHHPDFDDADWPDFQVGDRWGGYDILAWFRAWLEIPQHWRGGRVSLRLLVGPRDGGDSTAETLLYVNGAPLQGIDIWHEEAWLPPEEMGSGRVHVALKAWSGVLGVPPYRRFIIAQMQLVDAATEQFASQSGALLAAAQELDENDMRRHKLVELLDQSYARIDWSRMRSDAFYDSVQAANEHLKAGVAALAEVREIKPKVWGIGHAHIDVAWLWRIRHSREKTAHTFATALHLMRQYPEFRFMHSTPQLYAYLKADYPEIYTRVKAQIAAGTWEITGGMWVEPDVNLISGESLIRQFLHGTRAMREAFGVESRLLWLPDVFGYSAALPQIARGCGMDYFLTSKISWSQFNRFPYDTFRWRGLDGSEILTHFVTTPEQGSWHYTYNGEFRPGDVQGIWNNYRQKQDNDELLMLFGWGDGGGGPTREMLESARALANLPGFPSVGQELSEPFFARLAERVKDRPLPTWNGELYLEFHRGTYTSQAANKRANRRSELLYRHAEWLHALADTLTNQQAYPHAALDEGWKLMLLNQFHDILPGSSIRQVYEDSMEDYARIFAIGEQAQTDAQERLLERIGGARPGVVVFNPLSWRRNGMVSIPWLPELDGRALLLENGQTALSQTVEEHGERRVLFETGEVPPLGYRRFELAAASSAKSELHVSPTLLENRFYRIDLNKRGQIVSLWDKRANRQVLATGARANVFQTFVDKPMAFDAWDIDIYYQERMTEIGDLIATDVEEQGPIRGALCLEWRFGNSRITQRLTIYRDDPRIDFRTEVDWQEQQVLLKVAFPAAVHATRATYDIQFGQIERPTHWNTSWDWARFEVPAHWWADLSEGDYGVALLNDCKYGYDIRDNMMRLTLIKSAIRPDALADKGAHVFTYSLLPHAGDWRAGGVHAAASDLNVPLSGVFSGSRGENSLPEQFAFAWVEGAAAIIETVKRAEDEADAWVVRLYERNQCRAEGVQIHFGQKLRRAQSCNMVERETEDIAFDANTIICSLAPYQIRTFKVWFA